MVVHEKHHETVVLSARRAILVEARRMVAEELSKSPEWAPTLPVGCEVIVADAYQK